MNLVKCILLKLNNEENWTSRDSLCEEVINISLPCKNDVMISARIAKIPTCVFWSMDLEIYGLCTQRLIFPQNFMNWRMNLHYTVVAYSFSFFYSIVKTSQIFMIISFSIFFLHCIWNALKIWIDKSTAITFKHFLSQMFNRLLRPHIYTPVMGEAGASDS